MARYPVSISLSRDELELCEKLRSRIAASQPAPFSRYVSRTAVIAFALHRLEEYFDKLDKDKSRFR